MSAISPINVIPQQNPKLRLDALIKRKDFDSDSEYLGTLKQMHKAHVKTYVFLREHIADNARETEIDNEDQRSLIRSFKELIKSKDRQIDYLKEKKRFLFKACLSVSLITLIGIISTIVLSIFFPPVTIAQLALTSLFLGIYVGVGTTTGGFALKYGIRC